MCLLAFCSSWDKYWSNLVFIDIEEEIQSSGKHFCQQLQSAAESRLFFSFYRPEIRAIIMANSRTRGLQK